MAEQTKIKPGKAGVGAIVGGVALAVQQFLVSQGVDPTSAASFGAAAAAFVAGTWNFAKHKWFKG